LWSASSVIKGEVIVRFVDIGGIDYYHCLNVLFLLNALMWNFRETILMTGVTVPFNINNVCSG
jgi:hypothetical protein